MFSKYFLLLAGLFLLDHGHSSHLIPLKIQCVALSATPARQPPWLGPRRWTRLCGSRAVSRVRALPGASGPWRLLHGTRRAAPAPAQGALAWLVL